MQPHTVDLYVPNVRHGSSEVFPVKRQRRSRLGRRSVPRTICPGSVKDLEVAHAADHALLEPDAVAYPLIWSPAIRIPPAARSAAGQPGALLLAAVAIRF
jgi:hypothetical protein